MNGHRVDDPAAGPSDRRWIVVLLPLVCALIELRPFVGDGLPLYFDALAT